MTRLTEIQLRCYLYDLDGGDEPFATIYTINVPEQGEQLSIWNKGDFEYYVVETRVYGINMPEERAVWNLYLRKIKNLVIGKKKGIELIEAERKRQIEKNGLSKLMED
jgi:hypothetical protein